jgi:hypothetical protein
MHRREVGRTSLGASGSGGGAFGASAAARTLMRCAVVVALAERHFPVRTETAEGFADDGHRAAGEMPPRRCCRCRGFPVDNRNTDGTLATVVAMKLIRQVPWRYDARSGYSAPSFAGRSRAESA